MPGLELDDLILDRDAYAAVRPETRKQILPLRRERRVQLGAGVALEFENEQTLTYQAQEMIYAENITSETAAGEELATYRRLLPTPASVCATLFLEFTDVHTVRADLDALAGIQNMIVLRVGDTKITGVDVPPPDEANDEQTYSVHFVRFDFPAVARQELADLTVPAELTVEHPAYRAGVPMPPTLRAHLVADLAT